MPFKPAPGRSVYCRECFRGIKEERAQARNLTSIICDVCPRACKLEEGEIGFCNLDAKPKILNDPKSLVTV